MKKNKWLFVLLIILGMSTLVSCSGGEGKAQGSNEQKEREVKVNNEIISLNEDIEEVVGKIGESKEYTESKSCLYEGFDRKYTYDDVVINTYPKDDKNYVSTIDVLSKDVILSKNVKVGDGINDVVEAFGEDYAEKEETYCTYEYGDYGIAFYFEDGLIDVIELYVINN